MIRHYCDVCGNETKGGIDVIMNNVDISGIEQFVKTAEANGTAVYRELCRKCARKIAIYIVAKCKDDD